MKVHVIHLCPRGCSASLPTRINQRPVLTAVATNCRLPASKSFSETIVLHFLACYHCQDILRPSHAEYSGLISAFNYRCIVGGLPDDEGEPRRRLGPGDYRRCAVERPSPPSNMEELEDKVD